MNEVSVVIPTLNEEETIGICIEKVKKAFNDYHINGEIIVADNSTDKTPEIAKSLGANVVTPDRRGYGYAYLYGFKHASGKYIVMGDGDDTYDFIETPKLLEPLKNGEADFVIGSRFKGEIKEGAMPWLHKYIGNPVLTWFLNFFFKVGVSDAHCGFRAFKREALEKMNLRCRGMEFASEMLIRAADNGIVIKEVPITYYPRKGESKLSSFSDGWRHLRFMLLLSPTYLFLLPGVILFFLGVFGMFLSLFNVKLAFPLGERSMIAGSLLSIIGYQIVFLGLFAKIYQRKIDFADSVLRHLSLERGGFTGLLISLAGFIYSLHLLLKWSRTGFGFLPSIEQSILGYTLIVIGLQTLFSSFFLSLIGER